MASLAGSVYTTSGLKTIIEQVQKGSGGFDLADIPTVNTHLLPAGPNDGEDIVQYQSGEGTHIKT